MSSTARSLGSGSWSMSTTCRRRTPSSGSTRHLGSCELLRAHVAQVLAHKHFPLKFGGVFHAGVEVNGMEYCFGFSASKPLD